MSMPDQQAAIVMPNMCDKHQYLLVQQAAYGPRDAWQALIIASQIVLFQAATCDNRIWKQLGGDVTRVPELGCLACQKPDAFGEIVEAAKTHDLKDIKALGDKWIANAGPLPPTTL